MTYAKFARGLMSRYLIKNKITNPGDIRGFDYENYVFNNQLSGDKEWIFTRGQDFDLLMKRVSTEFVLSVSRKAQPD